MLEVLYGLEFLLLMSLVVVWGLAGFAANGLKYTSQRLWRQTAHIGVWTGFILLALWCAITATVYFALGWHFVMDRVIVMLPLFVLPALLVARRALPLLNQSTEVTPESAATIAAAVHTMAAGTLLTAYLVLCDIPAIPDLRESVVYLTVLAASALLLHLYHRRRAAVIRARRQGIGVLAFRSAVWMLSAFGLLMTGYLWSLYDSKFPASMSMIHPETFTYGGGAIPAAAPFHRNHHNFHHHHHHHASATQAGDHGMINVTELTGPQAGSPDKRFKLIAQKQMIELPSGHVIEAWTFNGQVPGPMLVVNEGDLVEVKLINRDIDQGVTVHWHGVDVPNAEDGVAGVTQNAVMPGESYTYRFVVNETGSHWYHSHQVSSIQVVKGLFGPFIILPKDDQTGSDGFGKDNSRAEKTMDITVFSHDWETPEGIKTVLHVPGSGTGLERHRIIQPGTKVRLRLINSSSPTKIFSLNGTPFRVSAIDGWSINEPEAVTGKWLKIGGGGRYDVTFTMPDHPVTLALHREESEPADWIVFSHDGRGTADIRPGGAILNPLAYGTPAPIPIDDSTKYDREFLMVLDQIYLGHYNGRSNSLWTINGEVFPHTPTFVVEEGDWVKVRIVNRSFSDHPMHLHGHHVVVLSRNGKPYQGSPLVLDTVLVDPGETWELAFRADNPGIWMDHCHILEHAAWGMTMHLIYANVTTPYTVGEASGNYPE